MEKRKHSRLDNVYLVADLSDGQRFFSGTVHDLSCLGLCLADVPQRLNHRARQIYVVVSGDGKNFKMTTRACWSWQVGNTKTIGLEILRLPPGWVDFVEEHIPSSTIDQ